MTAGIPNVNLILWCHHSGIYCLSWKRELRSRSMAENFHECLISQFDYGTGHQKCFRSTGWFCLLLTALRVKWSVLMKTYKSVLFHSLNVSIPPGRIFLNFVLVVFLTLYLAQSWICILVMLIIHYFIYFELILYIFKCTLILSLKTESAISFMKPIKCIM